WDLDERLIDQDRDRVEVRGVRLKAEALGLERDGAATREGVEDRGRVAVGGLEDLGAGLREELLVADVLPYDEALDDAVEAFALLALELLCGELLRVGGRVVDELREEDCARGSEWAAGPPQVQSGGVAVADRFFARGLLVD